MTAAQEDIGSLAAPKLILGSCEFVNFSFFIYSLKMLLISHLFSNQTAKASDLRRSSMTATQPRVCHLYSSDLTVFNVHV